MQCHVHAAKASRWLMMNEVFKPRTSEHLPQICQQTFGEPSVMSNAPCWCFDWSHPFQKNETSMIYYESFLSKQAFWLKLWALSWISTKNLVQTKTSIQDPAVSFTTSSGGSYPMYLYRFQGSNHSIALATFLLRPARGARGSAKGVPEANLPKDHMKPKWTHVSTIN